MPVTAVQARSPWAKELKHARASLLGSAAWRNVVANPEMEDADLEAAESAYEADSSLGQSAATEKVVFYLLDCEAFPEDPAAALPRASIRHMTDTNIRIRGGLAREQSGEVWMQIELKVPDVYANQNDNDKFANALHWGENVVGNVAVQMCNLRDTAGCLNIESIDLVASGFYDPTHVRNAFVYAAELLIRHRGP